MKAGHLIFGAAGIMSSRIFNKRKPLIVGFSLTNRCNMRCKYCNIHSIREKEMSTDAVLDIIRQLSEMGCIRIGFTGGEPLLRDDLGKILDFCVSRGIQTVVTSNGILASKRMDVLSKASQLIISMDGPRETNDKLRGRGAFDKAVEALSLAKKNKIPVALSTVISKANINDIGFMLDFSEKNSVPVHYQPVCNIPMTQNNIRKLALSRKEIERVASLLIGKRKGNKNILNSPAGLKQLAEQRIMKCAAGRIFFRISSSGELYGCWRQTNKSCIDLKNIRLRDALNLLQAPRCKQCCLADGIELSLLYNCNMGAVLNALSRY